MPRPTRPKVYHITHAANLAAIATEGVLVSDAEMIRRGGPSQTIGMSSIKRRRVEVLNVSCHPRTKVGDYVPFYFCPRSVMLYVIYRANDRELTYRGGQDPIVHLEADLEDVVAWAEEDEKRWAFSLSNAGASYTEFRCRFDQLDEVHWNAVEATDFRPADIMEGKQAEFLLHETFPFHMVERIGVRTMTTQRAVTAALASGAHTPRIDLCPEWYY